LLLKDLVVANVVADRHDPALIANYHHDYDFFDPINQPVVQTRIATFLCPAAPADRVYTIESNASGNSRNPNKDTLFKAECGPNDFISSNGLSVPRQGFGLSWPEGLAGNQHQSMTDGDVLPASKITDGLAHTFLLIEQAGAPQQWRLGKLFKGPGIFAGQNNSRGTWAGFGSIQFRVTDPEDGYSPGRGDDTDCVVNCNNTFGIYGFHEAGANVLLCDGSVRFVGQALDGLTHARLTTRDDGQLISAEGW
jgi:prepilin-type processing-associated H-X9-DG protein